MTEPVVRLTEFGRALRAEGLPVGTGRIESFCRAAALLPPEELYWAGRATLVGRRDDLEAYDRVFRSFFRGTAVPAERPRPRRRQATAIGQPEGASTLRPDNDRPAEVALASPIELLRRKSFAACSAEELAELARLMAELRLAAPPRRSRRRQARRAGELDVRRTVRRALRTGGDPARLARRERRLRPRRLVLLLDVSGSMSAYSRALLVFAHAALRTEPTWEAFCFGTRLTRLTGALATTHPDEALRRATEDVVDWDGGTRIGDALNAFLAVPRFAALSRGAALVVLSDGLERGDPTAMADAVARLARLCWRIIWLTPLAADPAFEARTAGLVVARPYLDRLSDGSSIDSICANVLDMANEKAA
jgi:uncharacterized protein